MGGALTETLNLTLTYPELLGSRQIADIHEQGRSLFLGEQMIRYQKRKTGGLHAPGHRQTLLR